MLVSTLTTPTLGGETKEEALYYADRLDSGLASHGFGSNAIKRLLSWAHDPSTYLGYLYSHDSLSVIYEPAEGLLSSKGLSRRQCFKIAMAFYDPLGLGVEYAVALRAMVRKACSSSVGWDDLVESSLAAKLVTLAIGIKASAPTTTSRPRLREASKAAVVGDFTYVPTSTSPLSPTDQPAEDDCRVCAPIEVDTRNSDPRVQDLANFFDESTIKDLQQRHLKTRAIIATLRAGPDNEKAPNLRCYCLVDGVLHYTGVTSLVNDRTRAEVSLPVLPRVSKLPMPRSQRLDHQVGDLVWRFRRGSMKQASSWVGPYRVTAASDADIQRRSSTSSPMYLLRDFIDSYQESEAADDDILMADPHEVAENMVNPDAVIDEAPSVPAAPGEDVAQELTDDIIIQDLLDEHLLAEIRGAEGL
ncbi:hypothetical protein FOZ60_008928 [Perkinsus olseni]|uniref:Uncharacterized protein n=1 Tax=Perkinsus olseni TaxID=32597 RepID=A0A7J6PD59_PEROL|nr:hypothetical protein FOZ60_008928 [Perkinsus olseni]